MSWKKKWLGGGVKWGIWRERESRDRGREEMKREGEERDFGETGENQRWGGQAKMEWFEMYLTQSLWWTITAWSTAHAADRLSIELQNQFYQFCFHTADSVYINTHPEAGQHCSHYKWKYSWGTLSYSAWAYSGSIKTVTCWFQFADDETPE